MFHVAVTRGSRDVLVVAGTPASPFVSQLTVERDPHAEPEPELRPRAAATSPNKKARSKRPIPEASSIAEASLRESLRTWRTEQARADGVPAYVVFNDTTLFELARLRPLDDDALLEVSGIGPVKVEKYGEAILGLVASALDEG